MIFFTYLNFLINGVFIGIKLYENATANSLFEGKGRFLA